MKTFLKIVLGLVVVVALGVAAVSYFSSDQREMARQFVILTSTDGHAEARELMHDALKDQLSTDQLAEMFAGTRPYTEVTFTSVEMGDGVTTLAGTARTADDCTSTVAFEVLGGKIVSFDITPLCR